MILPSTTKILIVPEFGRSAGDRAMVAIKEAIDAVCGFNAKSVDIRQMVVDEHAGEDLDDFEVVKLAARKIEALAGDKSIVWDKPDYGADEPLLDSYLDDDFAGFDDEETIDVPEREKTITEVINRRLPIRVTVTNRDVLAADEPDLLVAFGRSAMLTTGVKDKPILLVNPLADSQWPWTEQFHADRSAAADFAGQYMAKMNEPEDVQVLWTGTEARRRPDAPERFALFTDASHPRYFCDRHRCFEMVDEELDGNPEKLANAICDFAGGKMEFPLLEIFDMAKQWDLSDSIPSEEDRDRKRLAALRDAMARAVEKLPKKKRILIVPDYFTPHNAPSVNELRDRLRQMGYYVAVFVAGSTLKLSQRGIERRCKAKPFDLIVTLEAGCLLASRIANAQRIFVNPDWAAWERMKFNPEDIALARQMAGRSYIRRGQHCCLGWFTVDAIESNLAAEHMKRFNTCAYVPHLRLDTTEGIKALAEEINNTMKIDMR